MTKKGLSIIIPTWNEENNITILLSEIAKTLRSFHLPYEIIIVDDRSDDKTVEYAKSLKRKYPLKIYSKIGKRGKAQSLIEGFSYAQYSILCMIDADLQYPPSAILSMQKKIEEGADIVVAQRKVFQISLLRKVFSKGFHFIFSSLLHNLSVDTQSGLKVFRKKVIDSLDIYPTDWAFDMEFLVRARGRGFQIASVPIEFRKRNAGKTKINLLTVSLQLAINALSLKFISDVPQLIKKGSRSMEGKGLFYNGEKFINHTSLSHTQSALYAISEKQKITLLAFFILLILSLIINWHGTIFVIIATITILYFFDLLFNFFLIYRSFSKSPEIVVTDEEMEKVPENSWPVYTIFCPLYKEWSVVPQFISAINNLDYPKNKLQVLLLLEEDDKETIKRVGEYSLPSFMKTLIVPDSRPKTKPKALNFGLTKARGEYVVIYDAEDIPDPKQLKKSVLAFQKAGERTVCIQAKLNFYNPYQNMLTRVFTAEYSLWFDLVLTGLQSLKAPIPLGGTSNHFKTSDIRKLEGWDAFNVTEDCDLGTRLAKKGYLTAIVDSTTLEEANSSITNWFGQRSRWIKGYIQTYFVHMRTPADFLTHKKSHFLMFQLVVGAKIFSLFANPFMWMGTILYFGLRPVLGPFIESFFPAPVLYMGVFSLVFGNFLYLYYYMIGCAKRGQEELIPYALLVPFYWLFMSLASWKALYEFITNPHYWAKTRHGLHLSDKKAMDHAASAVGRSLVDRKFAVYPLDVSPAFPKKGW